jgi:DNA-binding HxlR family transcriptional regulator
MTKKTDSLRELCITDKCPMRRVQKLIAGKWKLMLLWHLGEQKRRFNELRRLAPEVSQRVLTQQLRDLERDGLVHREIYREIPPKVEYSLTPKGRSLLPLLGELCKWGNTHLTAQKTA